MPAMLWYEELYLMLLGPGKRLRLIWRMDEFVARQRQRAREAAAMVGPGEIPFPLQARAQGEAAG